MSSGSRTRSGIGTPTAPAKAKPDTPPPTGPRTRNGIGTPTAPAKAKPNTPQPTRSRTPSGVRTPTAPANAKPDTPPPTQSRTRNGIGTPAKAKPDTPPPTGPRTPSGIGTPTAPAKAKPNTPQPTRSRTPSGVRTSAAPAKAKPDTPPPTGPRTRNGIGTPAPSRSRRLSALGVALALGVLAVLPGNVSHADGADDATGRDFTPRGTQVNGLGTPSGAPEVGPGVYRDTIGPVGDPSGVKYYLVQHTPGSNMFISATARPPKYGDQDRDDGMTIRVRTQSWDECASWSHLREADYGMRGMSVTDVAVGVEDDEGGLDACTNERQLVLEIRRGDPDTQTPNASRPLGFELQIVEEPPVKNAARLPAPDDTEPTEDQGVAPRSPTRPVSAGTGFSEAATLSEGTSRDSIRPGELRFYRVRADWGQSIALSVRMHPDSALLDSIDESEGLDARLRVYNPVRAEVVASNVETYTAREPLPFHAKLPQIRYNNRETENSWPVSLAGYNYAPFELERDGGDFAVPVEISVDVTGTATGQPEYAGLGTPGPVPTKRAGESGTKVAGLDNPISIGIASAGGVLVLIGVVLGALFLRRSA